MLINPIPVRLAGAATSNPMPSSDTRKTNFPAPPHELQSNLLGMAVLCNIMQAFLSDAEQGQGNVRVKARGYLLILERSLDFMLLRELITQTTQGRNDSKMLQFGGVELMR